MQIISLMRYNYKEQDRESHSNSGKRNDEYNTIKLHMLTSDVMQLVNNYLIIKLNIKIFSIIKVSRALNSRAPTSFNYLL